MGLAAILHAYQEYQGHQGHLGKVESTFSVDWYVLFLGNRFTGVVDLCSDSVFNSAVEMRVDTSSSTRLIYTLALITCSDSQD